jgi:hypothetical protein
MGNKYWVKRENVTPTAAQDILTLISAASRRLRVLQIQAGGVGASSAPQGLCASRAPAGTTPGGAIVPSKAEHSEQPAATFTTATTWAAQPTPEANGLELNWNALGGWAPWSVGQNKGVLEARNGEVISIRPTAGPAPQAMNLSVLVEED